MGGPHLSNPELFCTPGQCDYFHPNDAGHFRMAEIAYEAIFGPNLGAQHALTVKRPDKADIKNKQEMDKKNEEYEKKFMDHVNKFGE